MSTEKHIKTLVILEKPRNLHHCIKQKPMKKTFERVKQQNYNAYGCSE